MGSVNLVLIVMSIQELVTHKGGDETKTFHLIPLICVCISWGEWDTVWHCHVAGR